MFQAVEEIPKTLLETYKTYRQRIREDIIAAESQGVYRFKFTGDYNYRTLGQTAREEAERLNRDAMIEYKAAKVDEDEANEAIRFGLPDKRMPRKYKITVMKTDENGNRDVYCEIAPENLDKAWAECKELHRKNEEARAKRERERLRWQAIAEGKTDEHLP